jgi:ribose 5-phosphate isomerase B
MLHIFTALSHYILSKQITLSFSRENLHIHNLSKPGITALLYNQTLGFSFYFYTLIHFFFNHRVMSPFNLKLPVAIGCDHAGFDCKEDLISFLEGEGVAFKDFGTYTKDSVDYPDFAHPVANAVEKGEAAFGILLCGSANGVAITANKHQGIRAAICWGEELAELARKHNDANIICIPARFVRDGDAEKMLDVFMTTAFEGGRHGNRVQKVAC